MTDQNKADMEQLIADAEKVPLKIKQKPVNMVAGEGTIALYSNMAAIVTTPFDLQLVFGEITEVGEEKAEARALVRVIMAPEHARCYLVRSLPR
jgi:hypothetical protein